MLQEGIFASCPVKQRRVNTQLVGDSFVFSRKKPEKAEVAAVVLGVLWGFEVCLGEIDDAAVLVPTVDETVDDVDFLVVSRQFFEGNDFIPRRLDDLVTDSGVDVFGKVLQKCLVLVLVEVFREKEDFVELQQFVKHVQQDVRFAGIDRTASEHLENIRGHGGVPSPVAVGQRKGGVIVKNFHFLMYHASEEAAATCGGRS